MPIVQVQIDSRIEKLLQIDYKSSLGDIKQANNDLDISCARLTSSCSLGAAKILLLNLPERIKNIFVDSDVPDEYIKEIPLGIQLLPSDVSDPIVVSKIIQMNEERSVQKDLKEKYGINGTVIEQVERLQEELDERDRIIEDLKKQIAVLKRELSCEQQELHENVIKKSSKRNRTF